MRGFGLLAASIIAARERFIGMPFAPTMTRFVRIAFPFPYNERRGDYHNLIAQLACGEGSNQVEQSGQSLHADDAQHESCDR